MKNELQHITLRKARNFYKLYVTAKDFSEREYMWSSL